MRYTDYLFDVPEEKIVRVIVDTDAKNEGDDQFAIVQALLSPRLENVGFIAAHYGTRHLDSMERSYKEILKIFELTGFNPKDWSIREQSLLWWINQNRLLMKGQRKLWKKR
jgi:purine nucleosidase